MSRVVKVSGDEFMPKTITDVLKEHILVHESKTAIRNLIRSGGVIVNDFKVENDKTPMTSLKPLGHRYFVFKIAKKNFYTLQLQKEIEPHAVLL